MVVIIIETLFVGLIIALILSVFLAKTITNPIENITYGASKIAAGDFSYQLPVKSSDEIGTLTRTFNNMAGVLKDTLEDIDRERNKLKTTLLYLSDGVTAFDREGVLIHINKAALAMLGQDWRESESTFGEVFAALPEADFEKVRQTENFTTLFEIGQKKLRVNFAPFDASPAEGDSAQMAGGVVAIIHDVTEEQRLEQSRRDFIANVSHELRTPLANIKGYTETVLDTPDLTGEERERFLSVVTGEADRMARIVKDLLVLSRLDSNKMDLHFVPFSMEASLRKVYEAMLIDARKHAVELTLEIDHSVSEVVGDCERIEQVLVNIISNAVKYTPEGGAVRVEAEQSADAVFVKVTDNGIGIPKEDLPHVFERFYRVDKARSRAAGGTGLGLAIAKEMVEAHGGSIDIKSRLGEGTEVFLTFPVLQRMI
nr:ATP-binding protein [Feifania hominis]